MMTGDYAVKNLETYAQNVIFTPVTDELDPFKRSQLPMFEGLVDSFNLSCIFKPKFLQGTCDYYMQNFLEHFYIYDLPKDYENLLKLSDRLERK